MTKVLDCAIAVPLALILTPVAFIIGGVKAAVWWAKTARVVITNGW